MQKILKLAIQRKTIINSEEKSFICNEYGNECTNKYIKMKSKLKGRLEKERKKETNINICRTKKTKRKSERNDIQF